MPQAPLQPMDYRRMYDPSSCNIGFRQHYHQGRVRRETASSEVQTEPCADPIHKLMDDLVGLRASGGLATERELDGVEQKFESGVWEDREQEQAPPSQRTRPANKSNKGDSQVRLLLPRDSMVAMSNTESSQSGLGELTPNDTWSLGSGIAVLPLDSSSLHEKDQTEEEEEEEAAVAAERPSLLPEQSLCSECPALMARVNSEASRGPGLEDQSRHQPSDLPSQKPDDCRFPIHCLDLSGASPEHRPSEGQGLLDSDKVHIPCLPVSAELTNTVEKEEMEPYRILRLPCDKVTTGMLNLDNPLCSSLPASLPLPPPAYLSSLWQGEGGSSGGAFYYSYYPSVCPDRQSVLNPSLDELSSREELFSTDVEDQDLTPAHVLIGGKMAANPLATYEGGGDTADHTNKEIGPTKPPGATRFECPQVCVACGTSLEKTVKRQDTSCGFIEREESDEDAMEEEEGEETEEEDGEGAKQVLVEHCIIAVSGRRAHHPSWQSRGGTYASRPAPRRRGRRGCYEGHGEVGDRDQDLGHGYAWVQDCCHAAPVGRPDKYKGPRNPPPRPYNEKPRGEGAVASDQDSWGSGKHNPQSWRPYNGAHEPTRAPRRRPACRTFVQQRSRRTAYDDGQEAEFPSCPRGRGTTKRRGTRY